MRYGMNAYNLTHLVRISSSLLIHFDVAKLKKTKSTNYLVRKQNRNSLAKLKRLLALNLQWNINVYGPA